MKKTVLLLLAATTASFAMAQQVVPNGDFEKWDSLSIVDNIRIFNPEGWNSYNSEMVEGSETFQPVQMTSDAHRGNYAVKISSKAGIGKGMPGVLFTGNEIDPEKEAGFPISGKIDQIEGYYKYAPDENDSATIVVMFFKDGAQIGGALNVIKQAAVAYTKFSLQLQYPENAPDPDAAKVYVFAGAPENESSNSVLYLDDLNFIYKTQTGIMERAGTTKSITAYPNPANNTIKLLNFSGSGFYTVTDVQGRTLLTGSLINNEITVAGIVQGVYLVKVVDADGAVYQSRFIKE